MKPLAVGTPLSLPTLTAMWGQASLNRLISQFTYKHTILFDRFGLQVRNQEIAEGSPCMHGCGKTRGRTPSTQPPPTAEAGGADRRGPEPEKPAPHPGGPRRLLPPSRAPLGSRLTSPRHG